MFEQIEKWAGFVLANLLWSVFAIPIVTIPIGTVGLFAVMSKRARGQQADLFQEFFGAVRHLWLKALIIFFIDIAIGGLIEINLTIFGLMPSADIIAFLSRSVTLFLLVMVLLVNIYVWSLMVIYDDMPVLKLIQSSYKLVFTCPAQSFIILVLAALPTILSLLLPRGVFFLLTASCTVLIITAGTWPIIQCYESNEELGTLQE